MNRLAVTIAVCAGGWLCGPLSAQAPIAERIGCTHTSGDYTFTTEDMLNEGARRILELGTKTIRVWFFHPDAAYPRYSTWPSRFSSMRELAEHPYFVALFNKPFKVYVLTAYSNVSQDIHYFRFGVSTSQYQMEVSEFRELSRYLLETYRGTGKIFVLQHWEGDWAIRGSYDSSPAGDPGQTAINGMISWLNARQDGVNLARQEVSSDVRVYHASEANLVQIAMQGRPTLTNNVFPYTYCDAYGYSAYDTIAYAANDTDPNLTPSKQMIRAALDYMASKCPDSAAFGNKNVYLGEYGWPEQERGTTAAMRVIRAATEEGLAWGCPWLLYWQVYDNECQTRWNPTNSQCRGFWLYKPDGTYGSAFPYLKGLINPPPPGATGTINGTVRNQWGDPVSVAAVYIRNADSYVTASAGSYTLKVPPGSYQITVYKPDHAGQTLGTGYIGAGQTINGFNLTIQLLPPDPVTQFTVTNTLTTNRLSWRNPASSHFTGTLIRFRHDRFPTGPADGTLLADVAGSPGSTGSYTHSGLTLGVPCYYAAFAHNSGSRIVYADPATAMATPAGPGDLDADTDVDLDDFALFQVCMSGQAVPQNDPACRSARMDADADVDYDDLVLFRRCISGADIPADLNCAN